MLRLVVARGDHANPARRLHVAFFGLDSDLAVYVEQLLRGRWSELVVHRIHHADELDVDAIELLVCGTEPDSAVSIPTLWLGDIERSCRPYRVSHRLWKSATPIYGKHLIQMVEGILSDGWQAGT